MINSALVLKILILSLLVFDSTNSFAEPFESCRDLLRSKEELRRLETESIAKFRNEIQSASDDYQVNYPNATVSMLRGGETKLLKSIFLGHMIYLASGADIYRPLYDFPFIQHYHLVDSLAGWGKNPKMVLTEIMRRLSEIGNGARVRILQQGFLEKMTEKELETEVKADDRQDFMDTVLSRSSEPMVLSVDWESKSLGPLKKIFYIHAADFHNFAAMKVVVDSIPTNEPVVGVLEAGWTSLPPVEVFNMLMNRLSGGGRYVFEILGEKGTPVDYENQLKSDFGQTYRVQITEPDAEKQIQHFYPHIQGKLFFELHISNLPMVPL
jgi:hypothetical protein